MELLKFILKDLGNIASKTVVSKFVKSVSKASIFFSFIFFLIPVLVKKMLKVLLRV